MPDLELEGRLTTASNATFLGVLRGPEGPRQVVYKPLAGERPLWDFPGAVLAHREVATYAVSEALAWGLVPPTWLGDGPHGPGMLQEWVEEDPDTAAVDLVSPGQQRDDHVVVLQARDEAGQHVLLVHEDSVALRRIALLDVLVNNADRKGSHVLASGHRRLAIDHGVTFHVEPKLRTVLWGWIGMPLDDTEIASVHRVIADSGLLARLAGLLPEPEVAAFVARGQALLDAGTFPAPGDGWPAIPWPAL